MFKSGKKKTIFRRHIREDQDEEQLSDSPEVETVKKINRTEGVTVQSV